jgi:ABC-type nitrate/sulfonate/bicarbonate transport system permease component
MQPRRPREEVAESVVAEIRRRELRERRWRAAGLVLPILLLIGLWELVSWLNTSQQWFFPPLIPSPVDVARAANEEWKLGFLQTDIPVSVLRVVFGFLIAAGAGVVLGVLTGSVKLVQWVLHPILEFLRPVPPLALFPIFLLWFGIGEMSKIIFTAVVAFFPIYLNTYDAVQHVEPNLIRAAGALGSSRWQRFWRVIIPAAAPGMFVGLRLGYAISWFALVATELIAANSGLGYRILEGRLFFRVDRMVFGAIVIGILGYVTSLALVYADHRLFAWRRKASESQG